MHRDEPKLRCSFKGTSELGHDAPRRQMTSVSGAPARILSRTECCQRPGG